MGEILPNFQIIFPLVGIKQGAALSLLMMKQHSTLAERTIIRDHPQMMSTLRPSGPSADLVKHDNAKVMCNKALLNTVERRGSNFVRLCGHHFWNVPKNGRVYADTAFLNLTSGVWTMGPQMTMARWAHTCSLVTNVTNGNKEIVIVGGRTHTSVVSDPGNCTLSDGTIVLREVEILDLQTNTYRAGK